VNQHLAEVREIADKCGGGFMGLGALPKWEREDLPMMPKGRYNIMRRYMPEVGSKGLDMMFRTTTIQVNLDFSSEADMAKKRLTDFSAIAAKSGAMWTMPVRVFRRSFSRMASALTRMSTTPSMCRCISSTATAPISTRRDSRSAISSTENCPHYRARCRPFPTGPTI